MNKAVIYIHGQGGNADEAEHFKPLFPDADMIGFDYHADTPWDAKEEFGAYFDVIFQKYESVSVIANSIGAYFAMQAPTKEVVERAFFISPVVDMEKLIRNMMTRQNVTEDELREKKEIGTLSWEYLCYVREHPIRWNVPTHILYGENDTLTSFDTMSAFAKRTGATLDVMPGGEHWFHTEQQMEFLDRWLQSYC